MWSIVLLREHKKVSNKYKNSLFQLQYSVVNSLNDKGVKTNDKATLL